MSVWPAGIDRNIGPLPVSLGAALRATAARRGEALAIAFYGAEISFADLLRRVERLAAFLQHRCGVAHGAKHRIQQALLGRGSHAKQRGHQRWQRQLAPAGEGAGEIGMPRRLRKCVRAQGLGQVQQQGLDKRTSLSSYREMNSKSTLISMTYDLVQLEFTALGLSLIHI